MNWNINKQTVLAIGIGAAALVAVGLIWSASATQAADLGGTCCADLEERIAELETTAARKGNRKVSLTVYGQVNKGILFWDGDESEYEIDGEGVKTSGPKVSSKNQRIGDNGVDPSFVGFAGSARISKDWTAGYVLEIGVGGYDGADPALGAVTGSTNDIYVQRSYVYLKSDQIGALSLGHTSQATDDLDKMTTANTALAVRPLSPRPLTGPQVGEALDLFDGNRANVVRYDTPSFAGFVASASWATADEDVDDAWDVALRYAGEFSGFKVLAGAGYRSGIIVNGAGTSYVVDADDVSLDTWTVTGSVMHVGTGLFLTGIYGDGDGDLPSGVALIPDTGITTRGWDITGGIERKWLDIGNTTLFASYGKVELGSNYSGVGPLECLGADTCSETSSVDVDYYGFGVVQSIDAAAMDLFIQVRKYEANAGGSGSSTTNVCEGEGDEEVCGNVTLSGGKGIDLDGIVGMAGARIRF